jgi:hypothetical protein
LLASTPHARSTWNSKPSEVAKKATSDLKYQKRKAREIEKGHPPNGDNVPRSFFFLLLFLGKKKIYSVSISRSLLHHDDNVVTHTEQREESKACLG